MTISVRRPMRLLVGVATAVMFVGCEAATAVATATSPTAAPKCQAVLAGPSSVAATGGSGSVSISTQPECAWTASSDAVWITGLTPASGQGDGQLEFRATANRDPAAREGDIVVNDARIRVVQEAAPCVFDVRPGNLAVGAAGGTISVTVSAHDRCAWTATSHASWIEVDSPGGGTGSGAATLRTARNGGGVRIGNVTIAGQTFAVTQDAAGGPATSPGPGPDPAKDDDDGDDGDDGDGDGDGGKDKGKNNDKEKDKGKDDSAA